MVLCFGNKNSTWFHNKSSIRKATNTISSLIRTDGKLHTHIREIKEIIINYFDKLFTSSEPSNIDVVIDLLPIKLTNNIRTILESAYHEEKIYVALKQMHQGKAPSPDGMNPFFCQRYSPIVGEGHLCYNDDYSKWGSSLKVLTTPLWL